MLIDTPQPDNRLVLDKSGSTQIDYTLSEADKKRFSEGIAEAIRIMFKAGAKEVSLPTTADSLGKGAEGPKPGAEAGMQPQVFTLQIKRFWSRRICIHRKRSIVTSAHMQATDKMGASPQSSAVGQDFHVWGLSDSMLSMGASSPHRGRESDAKHLYHCKDLCGSLESPAITNQTTYYTVYIKGRSLVRRDGVWGSTLIGLDTHVAMYVNLTSLFVVINRSARRRIDHLSQPWLEGAHIVT